LVDRLWVANDRISRRQKCIQIDYNENKKWLRVGIFDERPISGI